MRCLHPAFCTLLCLLTLSNNSIIRSQEETIPTSAPGTAATPAVAASNNAAKPVYTLAYKFTPNETLRYLSHQKMTLHATFENGEQVDVSELKQNRRFTVQSVDEAHRAKLAMQFEHVWMMKKMDDQPALEYDSKMKAEDVPVIFRQVAHELKGLATVYYLTPEGTSAMDQMATAKVEVASTEKQVENAVTLVEGQENQPPIQLAPSSKKADAKSKDAGTFLLPLPDKPVSVGDSWKHTVTVPVRLTADVSRNVQILRTFRLDAVDGDIATISFRSSIESPLKTPMVRGQLIQAIPRGTMQFDHVKGRMVKLQMLHNQSVFGAIGPNGILNCVGESTEELITEAADASTAQTPASSATTTK